MFRFKSILLFVLILSGLPVFAQSKSAEADSVEREMNALDPADPDYLRKKAGAMGTLLQTVKFSDPQRALALCDELGGIYMQLGDSARAYEAMYRYKVAIYDLNGEYDKMLMNLEAYAEALNLIGQSDGYVYLDIGNVYFSYGMYDLAKENYKFAEEIFLRENNIMGLCTIYNNYAQMHMTAARHDSALAWLRKSHDLRLHTLKDSVLAHESMYLMSMVYRDKGEYDSATAFLRIVIADLNSAALQKHSDHIALHQEFAGAYAAMAVTFARQMEWDSAEVYFRKGEETYRKNGYLNRLPNLYAAWAKTYIARKDAERALEKIRKLEQETNLRNPREAMQLYSVYADYYALTGNKEQEYRNRMMYYRLDDSLQATGYQEQMIVAGSRVMQLQNKARIDAQIAELARKDEEARRSKQVRTIFLVVMGALGSLVIISSLSVYQLRKKNKIIEQYNNDLHIANATKEQLLSVVSHDLRGPFNTLIGISDLMVRNMKNKDFVSVTGNAELIRESSRKAYVLLDNLMQWVSLQKETIQVKKETVSLNELTDEVLLLFRGQALANSSTVVKDIRVTHAVTDRNLFQVILRNLVSNALKNIPVAGEVHIIMENDGNDLRVIVQDNGPGLSEADLKALFSNKDKTSIARKGGGLGLLLVEQFVRQLDGTISAENFSKGGARFTIVFRNAIQKSAVEVGAAQEEEAVPVMSARDWQIILPVLEKLRDYEIYDTTEIRDTMNKIPVNSTPAVEWWRSKVLESVYRSDEIGFRALINVKMT